jgi:hypothetical protein
MKRNSQTPIINAVVNDNNVDEYYPITEEEQQIISKANKCSCIIQLSNISLFGWLNEIFNSTWQDLILCL